MRISFQYFAVYSIVYSIYAKREKKKKITGVPIKEITTTRVDLNSNNSNHHFHLSLINSSFVRAIQNSSIETNLL